LKPLPAHRGNGLGAALRSGLMDEAAAAGKAVSIQVERFNPAMRLYRRPGFKTKASTT
jgi:GNAT superfamily N-acetyltransferase